MLFVRLFISLFISSTLLTSTIQATSQQQQQHHHRQQHQQQHQQQQQQTQTHKNKNHQPHAPISLKLIKHPVQLTLIEENPGTLMAVARALKMAKVECQYQMRHEPWDCPIFELDVKPVNMFGKLMTRSFRETSFIHSLLSAALAHSVTKACTDSMIDTCGRPRLTRDNSYRENIEFGAKFARKFMDATHQLSAPQMHNNIIDTAGSFSAENASASSSSSSLTNGNSYATSVAVAAASRGGATAMPVPDYSREQRLRDLINAHNDEAGILYVINSMRKECKCHGLSGTCNIETCWHRLPSFREVASKLHQNLDRAIRVVYAPQTPPLNTNNAKKPLLSSSSSSADFSARKSNKKRSSSSHHQQQLHKSLYADSANHLASEQTILDNSITNNIRGQNVTSSSNVVRKRPVARSIGLNLSIRSPNKDDLLFGESSPDFCEPNEAYSIKGTKGRICSENKLESNSCDRLCCGRGYKTEVRDEKYNCDCVFRFCCQLDCKTCTRRKIIHKCL